MENQVLKEKLGGGRILLNDDQRRRLAVKGKILGRKRLLEIGTLFTPDTILRCHRQWVARKWDYSKRRKSPGRPRTSSSRRVRYVVETREKRQLSELACRSAVSFHCFYCRNRIVGDYWR